MQRGQTLHTPESPTFSAVDRGHYPPAAIMQKNIDFRVLFIAQKVVKSVFVNYPLLLTVNYDKMWVQTHFLLLFVNKKYPETYILL